VRSSGDEEMRNEMFICGVFSLLHRLFKQPLADLLATVPVPQRVYQTLVDGTGPYMPYFELVQAIEAGSLFDFSGAAESLMMSVQEINRAELRALSAAKQLE
jgi:EAL and modified HD-GYP domain-containing signal transduction protein